LMTSLITLIYPYYNSPGMLAKHYAHWAGFSAETKALIDIIIVDDGSMVAHAINVPRPEGLPRVRIYRILEDKDWNWCGARNLGAKVAEGKWLFLTDMDHMVPEETIRSVARHAKPDRAYRFARLDYPDLTPTLGKDGKPKPHPNTWCMEKSMYWKVGGYDEFFSGQYGFDGVYHTRVKQHAQVVERKDVVWRVPRDVVADASTDNRARKAARPPDFHKQMRDRKNRSPSRGKILTIQFEWMRVL